MSERSRRQKIWDTALATAVGAIITAIVFAFCGIVWSAAIDIRDMRTEIKASRTVFTGQLAQIQMSMEEQADLTSKVKELEDLVHRQEMAFEELSKVVSKSVDKPLAIEDFIRRHSKRPRPNPQEQGTDQNQDPKPPRLPRQDYQTKFRNIQNQLQQQRQIEE